MNKKSWGATPTIIAVNDAQECVVWYKGRKISFVCTLPLDYEMQWRDLTGATTDDRPSPRGPLLEPLRPLQPLQKGDWQAAKQLAFCALQRARAKEREHIEDRIRQPVFL